MAKVSFQKADVDGFKGLLPRSGSKRRAGAPAAPWLSERQPHVSRSHSITGRSLSHRCARLARIRIVGSTRRGLTFDRIAQTIDRFTEVVGFGRYMEPSSATSHTPWCNSSIPAILRSRRTQPKSRQLLAKAFSDRGIADGVQVNSVLPGAVMTGRRRSYLERWAPLHNMTLEEATANFPREAGIARYGKPEEIAELMAFLVSPGVRWMTGSVLRMDGGEVKSI